MSAKQGLVLPRALNDLYEHARDFFISEDKGNIIGFCALHLGWNDLGEIKSLVVSEQLRRQGTGRQLVTKCINEAVELGIKRVFALTYKPDFFLKLGFREIDKSKLPQKIWGDCMKCPQFPECNEYAVIKNL